MKVLGGVKKVVFTSAVILAVFAVADLPRRRIPSLSTTVVRADSGCSLASLNGAYGLEGQGTVLPPALGLSAPTALSEVVIAHFNGAGTFFGNATVNLGGQVVNPTFTGTYAVNSDCTGTLTVNVSLGFNEHIAIIVMGGGQRFISTDTDTFEIVQRRGEKLGD